MMQSGKYPKLVGEFIRQKRQALGFSQRELGLLFSPAVTTQFVSNVERGVTPLPPSHVPLLTKALQVSEEEVMALLEKEYAIKLSSRLGKDGKMTGSPSDHEFIQRFYQVYARAPSVERALIEGLINEFIKKNINAQGQAGENKT